MARPKVLILDTGDEKYNIDDMTDIVDAYTNECLDDPLRLPVLKELCVLQYWDYDYVITLQRENDKLRQATKRLLALKESRLELNGVADKYNARMASFSLKQLGWADHIVVDSNERALDVMNAFNDALKAEPLESVENDEEEGE